MKRNLPTLLAIVAMWLLPVVAACEPLAKPLEAAPLDLVNSAIRRGHIQAAASLAKALGKADRDLLWLQDYAGVYQLLANGELGAAETSARALLHRRPLDPDVRHALINTLWAQKKHHAALFHISQNKERVQAPLIRTTYHELMDSHEVRNKPYGMSISFNAEPSSNINNGSDEEQVILGGLSFDLNDDARAKKGVNLSATASAFYRMRIAEDTELVAKGSVYLTKNIDSSDMDQMSFVLSPQIQQGFDNTRFGGGPIFEYQLYGYDAYAMRHGFGMFVQNKFSENLLLGAQGKYLWQHYFDEDFRDGTRLTFEASASLLLPADIRSTISIQYQRETTERDYLNSNAYGLGIELERRWAFLADLQSILEVSYQWQSFGGAYPLIGEARSDEKMSASLELSHPAIHLYGTSPTLTYKYVSNISNVSIKTFNSNSFTIGFIRPF